MLQGGIKAVVWTDVLQASIMFVGIIAVTIIVSAMYMYMYMHMHVYQYILCR